MKTEIYQLAPANSNWKLLLALPNFKSIFEHHNRNIAEFSSKEYRVCKVLRLSEKFGRDEIGIIKLPRLHHSKVPQTSSESERQLVMLCFISKLNMYCNAPFSFKLHFYRLNSPENICAASDSSELLSKFKSFVAIQSTLSWWTPL